MRILHIQKAAGIGGAEKHLSVLLPELHTAGLEIYYVILENPSARKLNDPLIQQMENNGIICKRIPLSSDLDVSAWLSLKKCIAQLKPDILHSHLIQGDLYAALMKFFLKNIRLVSSKHGYDEAFQAKHELNPEKLSDHKNIYYWLSRFSVKQADRIIVISQGLKQLFSEFQRGNEKIRTIQYGYESHQNPALKAAEYFLYIGRLIPFKHPDLLIDAYTLYIQKGGTLPLKIAGSGPSEKLMREKLKTAGLEKQVEFLGRIQNPEKLLSSAVCLCVSSLSEGFGLVSLEAMNASVPVLAFDVPALNEVVVHAETGFLCAPANCDEYSDYMGILAGREELREKMGQAGKIRLHTFFSVRSMVEKTVRVYEELS